MVLVAVGDDDRLDVARALAQIGEVGQHEIDADHLGRGEAQADVDDDDAVVVLDDGHVLADLPQAAEGQDAQRLAHAGAPVSRPELRSNMASSISWPSPRRVAGEEQREIGPFILLGSRRKLACKGVEDRAELAEELHRALEARLDSDTADGYEREFLFELLDRSPVFGDSGVYLLSEHLVVVERQPDLALVGGSRRAAMSAIEPMSRWASTICHTSSAVPITQARRSWPTPRKAISGNIFIRGTSLTRALGWAGSI